MAETLAGGWSTGLGVRDSGFGPVSLANVILFSNEFDDFPALEVQLELS
jgi:hypothetical protein